jgi:hypothetical protein
MDWPAIALPEAGPNVVLRRLLQNDMKKLKSEHYVVRKGPSMA